MSILKIARMGHPVLVAHAEPIAPEELAGPDLQRLIDDMIETMRDAPGVGLAAPQVYESRRLFVMDPGPSEDGASRLEVVVNPELTFPGDEVIELWEGCLSIPRVRGHTERKEVVHVKCLDRHGVARTLELTAFAAAVAQHENDHLDGLFFFSRMPDLTEIAFEDEFERWVEADADADADEDAGAPPVE